MAKGSGKPKKSVVTTDERFSAIHNDPRFRLPKRDDIKVELDDRFKKSDLEAIKRKTKIDKYGRKIKDKDSSEPFNKYYKVKEEEKSKKDESESEESGSDDDEEESKSDDEDEESEAEDDDSEAETADVVAKVDLARGEGVPSDFESSSDESSSDEESSEEEEEDEDEEDAEKPEEGEPSTRFAVVNLDWDNVKSVDLMATFQSFVPSSGHIDNVAIYPSEFGKERMQREDMEGPPKELFKKKSKKASKESDSEDDDSDSELEAKDLYEEGNGETDYDHKSLRRYQLQRLRYYYAVVTCDSIKTAKNIYDNCDGTEYESTANLFDLRYIPEEMEFDDEPRDSCNKIPTNYKPQTFVTDALQHSKVKLTWDETPAERVKLSSKAFSQRELDDMDFKAYLASDNSDEEESDHEDLKNKYKNLVGQSTKIGNKDIFNQDDDEDDVDMEITFTPGLDEKAANGESAPAEGEEESSIDKLKRKAKERRKARKDKIKELKKEAEEQKKADKPNKDKKSKKKQPAGDDDAEKKAELELLMLDENNKKQQEHFDLKELMRSEKEKSKKSKHRNKDKIIEDDLKPDLNDPRFKEIFTSHEFAIDPSQPQFKKTATMAKILEERNKRRDDGETASSSKPSKSSTSKKRKTPASENDDVNSLVQRIKRKSKK